MQDVISSETMCHQSILNFVSRYLSKTEVCEKSVLEVGSRNVNGSVRDIVESFRPKRYLGIDLLKGLGVDLVLDVCELDSLFKPGCFDLIICTEVLEHIEDWRKAIYAMKYACATGGIIFLTTRSIGFQKHDFPHDFWRFQREDMEAIFSDFKILQLAPDSMAAGIFVKAQKPVEYMKRNLDDYMLIQVQKENINMEV